MQARSARLRCWAITCRGSVASRPSRQISPTPSPRSSWTSSAPSSRWTTRGGGTPIRRAADFLNVGAFDVVCLQHEYGIFGGKAGSHVLALLRELRMPVVTTLHTLLAEPDPAQRAVLDEITRL